MAIATVILGVHNVIFLDLKQLLKVILRLSLLAFLRSIIFDIFLQMFIAQLLVYSATALR